MPNSLNLFISFHCDFLLDSRSQPSPPIPLSSAPTTNPGPYNIYNFVPMLICTAFAFVYAFNPSSPSSRPIPLCLTPPNGTR